MCHLLYCFTWIWIDPINSVVSFTDHCRFWPMTSGWPATAAVRTCPSSPTSTPAPSGYWTCPRPRSLSAGHHPPMTVWPDTPLNAPRLVLSQSYNHVGDTVIGDTVTGTRQCKTLVPHGANICTVWTGANMCDNREWWMYILLPCLLFIPFPFSLPLSNLPTSSLSIKLVNSFIKWCPPSFITIDCGHSHLPR